MQFFWRYGKQYKYKTKLGIDMERTEWSSWGSLKEVQDKKLKWLMESTVSEVFTYIGEETKQFCSG